MVKIEAPTSESDSGSEVPLTPLAASTQKTPPKRVKPDSSDDDDALPESEKLATESQASNSSKAVKNTKEKYLNKFPNVRPSKAKYSVDIDLSDSSDEVWIVKCPASIDAKKVLLGAKFQGFALGSVSKISSPHEGLQLEGVISKNSNQKPVTIMAGTDFKSWDGPNSRIARYGHVAPQANEKRINKSAIDVDEEIPFPEEIRDRHPLLGVDYKLAQRLPKHVKKALSLAQQRSEAIYLQKEVSPMEAIVTKQETSPAKGKKSRKRKREDHLDYVETTMEDEEIKMMIKEEAKSPSPRKKLKKENPVAEDDLSWLAEM
ncbi:AAEL007491-PA [Aedes aegypti]|uniref:AAEL007491-PA n=1 Tax=Aedes aegypti TaxID=7159 RepID=Q171Y5_AEDAE|nr:AAEL007491-PA [Aedes aegypti]